MPPAAPSSSAAKATARPIQRFAAAVAKCGPESAAYGACIFADYRNVTKDMCKAEFLRLKDCYVKHAKPR